jgi:hypothetical protein
MNTPVGTERLLWVIPLEVAGGVTQQAKEFVRREVKLKESWMELTLHRKEITQKFTARYRIYSIVRNFVTVSSATLAPEFCERLRFILKFFRGTSLLPRT